MTATSEILLAAKSKLGLAQDKDLAEVLGVTPSYVHELHKKGKVPSDDLLEKLVKIVGENPHNAVLSVLADRTKNPFVSRVLREAMNKNRPLK